MPIRTIDAVIGKFLAGWIFIAFSLLLTFPIVFTVAYLGSPDYGLMLTGYLSSLLLAGCYLVVSSTTSAMTQNQVISFVISAMINFFLLLLGWGVFQKTINSIFSTFITDLISFISYTNHYEKSKGKISLMYFFRFLRQKRRQIFQKLWELKLNKKNFQKLKYKEPYYFFVPKDFTAAEEYNRGFQVTKIFKDCVSGIDTFRDSLTIQFTEDKLHKIRKDFESLSVEELRNKYNLPQDGRDWTIAGAKEDIIKNNPKIVNIAYRPFDTRKTFFTGKSKGFIAYPRENIMKNMLMNNNFGLIAKRGFIQEKAMPIFITHHIAERRSWSSAGMQGGDYLFPLYLYNGNNSIDKEKRKANLNQEIVREIEKKLGLKFVADHELSEAKKSGNFSPLDLLDYIYAVLHSPSYRKKYQEFLKIDFPRVPYPEDKEKFKKLVKLGSQMRETHLLQGKNFGGRQNFITNYDIQGNNLVEKIYFDLAENSSELGRVYINKTQYFGKVPKVAWDFFIGGYQPAQKWLKDRKDRLLNNDEIEQYQKIILALKTTSDIMPQIDPILFS